MMLTKEQIKKIYTMGNKYYLGIIRTRNISKETAIWWTIRYRASMGQELLRRCKH